ncbi:MAG TPA: hypothetical protein ENI20_02105 [Bacteroides sp.]|nr:hypothetical protein [Bacteroides sp.]
MKSEILSLVPMPNMISMIKGSTRCFVLKPTQFVNNHGKYMAAAKKAKTQKVNALPLQRLFPLTESAANTKLNTKGNPAREMLPVDSRTIVNNRQIIIKTNRG